MDVSAVQSLYGTAPTVSTDEVKKSQEDSKSFGAVFDSVMGLVNETNTLQNKADAESIKFALGESENTHDLAIAQQKANIALQYTVAVRDRFISAYQEIMQMQM
ncbi:MAG: flagellar hook-basal body complex protein FliE [Lachnospiraceae bacterium]|nr:flagellar hook-basal body complex protein FliE [Lachnospiraceae bacterium]